MPMMRYLPRLALITLITVAVGKPLRAAEDTVADEKMLRAIYTAALTTSPVYENLRELTTKFPGRLSGSQNLQGAVLWGQAVLKATGADRTELQPVMVPHWERGAPESVRYFGRQFVSPAPLAALALGGSVPTPAGGLTAPVVELHSLAELKTTDVKGKIVFFNRPMNPVYVSTGLAYGEAGDQRNRDPVKRASMAPWAPWCARSRWRMTTPRTPATRPTSPMGRVSPPRRSAPSPPTISVPPSSSSPRSPWS